jgi:hypothetical protein
LNLAAESQKTVSPHELTADRAEKAISNPPFVLVSGRQTSPTWINNVREGLRVLTTLERMILFVAVRSPSRTARGGTSAGAVGVNNSTREPVIDAGQSRIERCAATR